MIGTLAVDGCFYIWYSEEMPGRAAALPSPLLAVPNVTAHPSTASVPTSYYSMSYSKGSTVSNQMTPIRADVPSVTVPNVTGSMKPSAT